MGRNEKDMTEYQDLTPKQYQNFMQQSQKHFIQQQLRQSEVMNDLAQWQKSLIDDLESELFKSKFEYPKFLWYLSIEMFPRKNKNICKIIWKKVWSFFKK